MPQLSMDGQILTFQPGESVIEAATRYNLEIPYYCWHPRLSVAANCRMCLVEVEKAPKLMPACQTLCQEGMVVLTQSPRVQEAQRAVHEFLLINHPIDCPICDQAGECKLQDYYMKYQLRPSRMRDKKVHKPKLERLGPYVIYNAERCIVCTRCVRFMQEVAHDRQLGVFNRGDHSVIGTFPGQELNSAYSLNTVDVCPVGALTSSVFRFKQRVWNLRRSPSICPGCARGCNVHADHRSSQVYRLLPRENNAVNQTWMCDEGRLTYSRANTQILKQALWRVPQESAPQTVDASKALSKAGEMFRSVVDAKQTVAVALSLHATCEEAYILGRLAKDVFLKNTVFLLGYADGQADSILRVADKNPNRAGIGQVLCDLGLHGCDRKSLEQDLLQGHVKALLCVGHEVEDAEGLAKAALGLDVFVHVAHAASALADGAHVTLPGASWIQTEGTWWNVQGHRQALTPAFAPQQDARPHHEWLQALACRLEHPLSFPSVQSIQAEMERSLVSFRKRI